MIVTDGHEGRLSEFARGVVSGHAESSLEGRINSATGQSAIPGRECDDVQAELVGIWRATDKAGGLDATGSEHSPNTANAIGEAVRSLAEDEEHLLTFYAFPQRMHQHIQTTNATSSRLSPRAAAHRSNRRLHDRDQLPHHRLGAIGGYPLAPASR